MDEFLFQAVRQLSLADIASVTGASPVGEYRPEITIGGIAPLDTAGPTDIAFLENEKFRSSLAETRAGALITQSKYVSDVPDGCPVFVVRDPYRAFVLVARELFPDAISPKSLLETPAGRIMGMVDPTARLGEGVTIDPGAIIGPRVAIGARTLIGANAIIAADVSIGADCSIGAGATISHAVIADRVIIHRGCHIGQDGFGYVGSQKGHMKVPQIGRVVIHADVEIGAGCTIDRGGMRDTTIGEGTKIDNLCQIGHNVSIGKHCIIVAQSGLSGSVVLEDFVMLGARVGIQPHARVGKGAQLAARSSVMRDVPAGARWGGVYIAKPMKQFFREAIALERLGLRSRKTVREEDGHE